MTAAAPPRPASGWSLRQLLVLGTIQVNTLLFGMTITLANVLLPEMRGSLSATPDQIAWVVTFNILATAVATPLSGWLANRFGWRSLMLWSGLGFTVTSALCGLAPTLETLVLCRAAQGAFGAPIMPIGQAILQASFPAHQQALVLMVWGIGGVFGPVLGPILAGGIAEAHSWRWAFMITVPFGVLGAVGSYLTLTDQDRQSRLRLDWVGFVSLGVAVGCVQLVLDRGQRVDWFDSLEIVVETALGVAAFYVFLVHSVTARQPFMDLRILRNPQYAVGLLIGFVFGMLMFTPLVLIPPLLQDLGGYPQTVIGYLIAARGIGNWASFLVVVQMTRWNAPVTCAVGFLCQAVAGVLLIGADQNVAMATIAWSNGMQGLGVGLSYTSMSVIAFSTLARAQLVEASALFHLLRNLGSSMFISISVSYFVRSSAENYARLTQHVSPFSEVVGEAVAAGFWRLEETAGLGSISAEITRQAAMIGYINAFYLFTAAAILALPLMLVALRARA